ncbi:MAG: hypothetical protein ACRD0Q_04780, partial [Acidimicrobiales bacterium]
SVPVSAPTRRTAALSVVAVVANDNGGTREVPDFPLFVDALPVTSGQRLSMAPGPHHVSGGPSGGYAVTVGGDCAADGSIVLAPRSERTCALTYDDEPSVIRVISVVVNDDGGTKQADDVRILVDGGRATAGTELTVPAGTHNVSTPEDPLYTHTVSGDCGPGGQIVLTPGQSKTCTLTSDDRTPH